MAAVDEIPRKYYQVNTNQMRYTFVLLYWLLFLAGVDEIPRKCHDQHQPDGKYHPQAAKKSQGTRVIRFLFLKKNVKKIKCILRKLPASLMEQVSKVFFKKKTQKIIAKKFPEARVNMRKKKN